jgi:integrase
MKAIRVAEKYLKNRVCCDAYAKHVRAIATRCGELNAGRINGYLKSRLETISTVTAANERTIILSLVKFAWDNGIIDTPIRGVFRIKRRRPPTKAWTIDQLRQAVAETERLADKTLRSGAKLDEFMRSWLLLGYESGARLGDVMTFRAENLDGDTLRWTQSKTGDGLAKHLSKSCIKAAEAMLQKSPDGRIVGWACGRRQAVRIMRQYLDSLGIGGTSKWLRRSGATHIEIEQPGKASLHLGHRTPNLAAQAYIDWGQVRKTMPATPEIA